MSDKYEFILGKCYGFLDCCIESFVKKEGVKTNIDKRLLNTGFLPCLKCSKKSYDEILNDINKTRLTPDPFPDSNYETTVYTILNSDKFTSEEKYFIINNFIYYVKQRNNSVNKINKKLTEEENQRIKKVFKSIDSLLLVKNKF